MRRSREPFRIHPVFLKVGEDLFDWVWGDSAATNALTLEVTTVRSHFVRQYGRDHPRAGPGHHGTAAELG